MLSLFARVSSFSATPCARSARVDAWFDSATNLLDSVMPSRNALFESAIPWRMSLRTRRDSFSPILFGCPPSCGCGGPPNAGSGGGGSKAASLDRLLAWSSGSSPGGDSSRLGLRFLSSKANPLPGLSSLAPSTSSPNSGPSCRSPGAGLLNSEVTLLLTSASVNRISWLHFNVNKTSDLFPDAS